MNEWMDERLIICTCQNRRKEIESESEKEMRKRVEHG